MTVVKGADGTFEVTKNGVTVRGGFETQAAAWRWIDRETMQVTSSADARVDWSWKSNL